MSHPHFNSVDYLKWRLAYEGGRPFVNAYLKRFSRRETEADFGERRAISYSPSFAKAAINDIKNAIFQRITDVERHGPSTYTDSVEGLNFGVDKNSSSMNTFIGRHVLPELLVLGRVGVLVDRTRALATTKATQLDPPFFSMYEAENIRNWSYSRGRLIGVELSESNYVYDEQGFPTDLIDSTRKIYIRKGAVIHEKDGDIVELKLSRIPFVMFELSQSLMTDVADYQIAQLNIASSDINYILKSNFPFYTEQQDPRAGQKSHIENGEKVADEEARVGVTHGRTYGVGMERPAFIAPPTEPLQASMAKQETMKEEIRQLINLTLATVKPRAASAESKALDERGLEAGLSYIALELQYGEQQLAEIWASYENYTDPVMVRYPEKYALKSEMERLEEAENLSSLARTVPSPTFKREVAKRVADLLLGNKIDIATYRVIESEIQKSEFLTSDPTTVLSAFKEGVIDTRTAIKALGFPESIVELAIKEKADRMTELIRTQQAMGGRPTEGHEE